MRLAELQLAVSGARLLGDPDTDVTDVVYDSRKAGPGSLFVAIQGLTTNGNAYVDAALGKGAVAIASEEPPRGETAWLSVPDAREALALLSAESLGGPARRLELIGVTGTNGKTTTTYIIDSILRAAGERTGLLGTVRYRIGDESVEAVRTTPESADLQALLRRMADGGCRRVTMEVSSISLSLKRVYGCRFRVGVFTNLTRDHLDFHHDMDSYFAAKRVLFSDQLTEDATAVVNADDDRCAEVTAGTQARVWTFSLQGAADLGAEDITLGLDATRFVALTPAGRIPIETSLLGRFNVSNLLAGIGATLALGIDTAAVQAGVRALTGVPGRLERIEAGQSFTVVVDYAHSDDALRRVLETIREMRPTRVITVFGCGGDRDRTKRPLMGAVAARLSDVIVLTSDNPRSESPEAILEDIRSGMPAGRGAEVLQVVDRREAIATALELASPGSLVLIAGKGHETTQVFRDRSVPFDDRQVVRELLRPASSPLRARQP